jgi:hypothetical protein
MRPEAPGLVEALAGIMPSNGPQGPWPAPGAPRAGLPELEGELRSPARCGEPALTVRSDGTDRPAFGVFAPSAGLPGEEGFREHDGSKPSRRERPSSRSLPALLRALLHLLPGRRRMTASYNPDDAGRETSAAARAPSGRLSSLPPLARYLAGTQAPRGAGQRGRQAPELVSNTRRLGTIPARIVPSARKFDPGKIPEAARTTQVPPLKEELTPGFRTALTTFHPEAF